MAGGARSYFGPDMNRSRIEAAVERNPSFTLRMADGMEYRVPHRDYISIPPRGAFVVVFDDREHVHGLPLLTMTGLTYQSEARKARRWADGPLFEPVEVLGGIAGNADSFRRAVIGGSQSGACPVRRAEIGVLLQPMAHGRRGP